MSDNLLEVLDFWERYPYNLACCRSAIMQIQENQDRVFLVTEQKDGVAYIPATVDGFGLRSQSSQTPKLGWKLTFKEKIKREEILHGFSGYFLMVGEASENTPAFFTPARFCDGSELWIHENEASALHEKAERFLCEEIERRSMDSSALVYSGRICRLVCNQITGPPNPSVPQTWPAIVAGMKMHSTDLEAIVTAERSLLRLKNQLSTPVEAEPVEEVKLGITEKLDRTTKDAIIKLYFDRLVFNRVKRPPTKDALRKKYSWATKTFLVDCPAWKNRKLTWRKGPQTNASTQDIIVSLLGVEGSESLIVALKKYKISRDDAARVLQRDEHAMEIVAENVANGESSEAAEHISMVLGISNG